MDDTDIEVVRQPWYQASLPDARYKAALFPDVCPQVRVLLLAQAGRVHWDEQPYVLAHMEAAVAEAVETKLAKAREAALRLIEVAEQAAHRDMYGMLGQEAENLRQALGLAQPKANHVRVTT